MVHVILTYEILTSLFSYMGAQVLESRANELEPRSAVLDALEHSVVILESTRESVRLQPSEEPGYDSSLVALELHTLMAFARSFERLAESLPSLIPGSSSRPSYAAFLLRTYTLIGLVPTTADAPVSALDISEELLQATVQSILTGARFLLREVSSAEETLSDTNFASLGTTEEIRALSSACWNLAQQLRKRDMGEKTDVDGKYDTTELLMAAHELQAAAEQSECGDGTDCSEGACNDTAGNGSRKRLRDGVNRVGILTIAASEVVDRDLLPSAPTAAGRNEFPALAKRARVFSALEWIVKAQTTVSGLLVTAPDISSDDRHFDQDDDASQQLETLGTMNAALSLLRLMTGLHGIRAPAGAVSSDAAAPATDEDALLLIVDECRDAISAVPSEALRAAASAAKQNGYTAVAHALLRIAIEAQKIKSSDVAPGGEDSLLARKEAGQLYCDLFHTSPNVEACLDVIDDILVLLESSSSLGHKVSTVSALVLFLPPFVFFLFF